FDFTSGILYATCYAPDRTLLREKFPLAPSEWGASQPLVMMSRASKKSLVSWNDQTAVYAKLLDEKCFMTHAHLAALNAVSGYYPAAIDDSGRPILVPTSTSDATVPAASLDATGARMGGEQMSPAGTFSNGIHVAMNQMSGGGVVSYQQNGTGD